MMFVSIFTMKYTQQLFRAVTKYYKSPSSLRELGDISTKNMHRLVSTKHNQSQSKITQHGRYIIRPGVNTASKKDPMVNDIIYEYDPHYNSKSSF